MTEAHATHQDILWGQPLISLPYIQSTCGRCHLAIFGSHEPLQGTEKLQQGLNIFLGEGCLGCHKVRSVGGNLGPDLTDLGNKTDRQYNFKYVVGEHTIYNWLKLHFRDPSQISPGSQMLKFEFDQADMQAIIVFILGLYKPTLPLQYYSLSPVKEFKSQREELNTKQGYAALCSACHGKEGQGKSYKENDFGVPSLNNPDFQAVASKDFIEFSIREGRGRRKMPSWNPKHSGFSDQEIKNMVNNIREWRPTFPLPEDVKGVPGNTDLGRELFLKHCSTCHGDKGQGDLGPSLHNPEFLSIASDEFLYISISAGRSNTAMPSWMRFSIEEYASLIKLIRTWQTKPQRQLSKTLISGDSREGQDLFHYLCVRCHGKYGYGGIAPAILNVDFLQAASDQFLRESISLGRSHTAMLGWTKELPPKERLTGQNLDDIVAYMRQSINTSRETLYPGESLGNPTSGKKLFINLCAECHGNQGEGKQAPLGRTGTAMPTWGQDSDKHRKLSAQERNDIVSFIRTWQGIIIKRKWLQNMVSTALF
jgi:cytochrome c oxidase cbb3-type subunit 3